MKEEEFQELIWQKAGELYRSMPWRENTNPYYVLVSELMLQQTQVERVIPKFIAFIEQFPTIADLAASSLGDVLILWSGLGYNRRAKYLHAAARHIETVHNGIMPSTYDELQQLPGVGPNTAGAIMAYAFNQPVVFIETNIRSVYFYHFFHNTDQVSDKEIYHLVETTIDREHPREWYWAIMDYGSWLKRQGLGRIRQSVHYKKQAALSGSIREMRGHIIRVLTAGDRSEEQLRKDVMADGRFEQALVGLVEDSLVQWTAGRIHLTK